MECVILMETELALIRSRCVNSSTNLPLLMAWHYGSIPQQSDTTKQYLWNTQARLLKPTNFIHNFKQNFFRFTICYSTVMENSIFSLFRRTRSCLLGGLDLACSSWYRFVLFLFSCSLSCFVIVILDSYYTILIYFSFI